MSTLQQGDILKIEKIQHPVLVVSKDFFNHTGQIIGCPVYSDSTNSPLHPYISAGEMNGYVQCEKLALLDMNVRGYRRIGSIVTKDRMEIADIIQGIFDYI